MRDVILECMENLGPAPRRLDPDLRIAPPDWFQQSPRDEFLIFFERQDALFENGIVAWGHIVQANSLLYEPGDSDHPAEVVYSLENSIDVDPNELLDISQKLYQLKGLAPQDPELIPMANHLSDEQSRVFGFLVPPSLCNGTACRTSAIVVSRGHLPFETIDRGLVPLLVDPAAPHVAMILPSIYWPGYFIDWWTEGREEYGFVEKEEPEVIDPSADSILAMNQPFTEFISHFGSEERAVQYYQSYVRRNFSKVGEGSTFIACRVNWTHRFNQRRKWWQDYVVRVFMPLWQGTQLDFDAGLDVEESLLYSLRRNIIIGRIGRFSCTLLGWVSATIGLGLSLSITSEWENRLTDPYVYQQLPILYLLCGTLIGSLILHAVFMQLSMPVFFEPINRGFFRIDSIQREDLSG